MKPTVQTLETPVDFVTKDGYEICVICHKKTTVRAETPIQQRQHYVEGCGQLCKTCGKKIQ